MRRRGERGERGDRGGTPEVRSGISAQASPLGGVILSMAGRQGSPRH